MTQPYGLVDTAKRLRHLVKYRDSASSESRARPHSAIGCEGWMKTTAAGEPAPTNPETFTCLGVNSASPFVRVFGGADGGKTAHYLLRWTTRDGAKSGWSEIMSASIVGF